MAGAIPLPPELECLIVHFATRDALDDEDSTRESRDEFRECLGSVAPRFQLWVDEIFYETVVLENDYEAGELTSLLQPQHPAFDPATVKYLCISSHVSRPEAFAVAMACTGVRILALCRRRSRP